MTTLEESVNQIVMPQRLGRALLMMLGAAALALTIVGVYGLLALLVSRNAREIGVRVALGATGTQVVGTVLRRAVWPIVAGAATGSVAAAFGGLFADRFMYGIAGLDPSAMALAVATTIGVGTLAAFVPTRRALRINPIETLRAE